MAGSVTRHKSAYTQLEPADVVTFGAFPFAGDVAVGKIADFYGLPVPQAEKATPVGNFIADRLPANPSVGDSIGIGMVGFVVHDVSGHRITRVGLVADGLDLLEAVGVGD
jgi:NhaP-type Na+/H+ and K+/H+ antiporter